jgi:ElaB/YqjD/DUF883 family membrane-anchored ribosome-binding protein
METYFKNITAEDGSKEKVVRDFKILANDSKHLLATATQKTVEELKEGAKTADRAVRAYPYAALALGLGAGFLTGWLLGGRSDD